MKKTANQQTTKIITVDTTIVDWKEKKSHTSLIVDAGIHLLYIFIHGLDARLRKTLDITLKEKSTLTLYGLSIGTRNQHLEADIRINHAQPDSRSQVILKGAFAGTSTGVINGTIRIGKTAIRSCARLEERILLLSPDASAQTIPNLEIDTDDVQASHAATVSTISGEDLFYLASRGLAPKAAQSILVNAFIASQLVHLPETKERDRIDNIIQQHLRYTHAEY